MAAGAPSAAPSARDRDCGLWPLWSVRSEKITLSRVPSHQGKVAGAYGVLTGHRGRRALAFT